MKVLPREIRISSGSWPRTQATTTTSTSIGITYWEKDRKRWIYWLLTGCLPHLCNGSGWWITRLTHSTVHFNYCLITGVLPPMDETSWQEALNVPTISRVSKNQLPDELGGVQGHLFWEWLHRLIGRLIGVVFLLPFLYFWSKTTFKTHYKKIVGFIIIGCLSGVFGWYMVKAEWTILM